MARELLFLADMATNPKCLVGEVVELSRDCELGQEGDRAVVTARVDHYMTLTFPDRAPACRDVHTGADYKYLRPCAQSIACTPSDLGTRQSNEVLRELRSLVSTYLEGSDDADRAWELLDALDVAVAS